MFSKKTKVNSNEISQLNGLNTNSIKTNRKYKTLLLLFLVIFLLTLIISAIVLPIVLTNNQSNESTLSSLTSTQFTKFSSSNFSIIQNTTKDLVLISMSQNTDAMVGLTTTTSTITNIETNFPSPSLVSFQTDTSILLSENTTEDSTLASTSLTSTSPVNTTLSTSVMASTQFLETSSFFQSTTPDSNANDLTSFIDNYGSTSSMAIGSQSSIIDSTKDETSTFSTLEDITSTSTSVTTTLKNSTSKTTTSTTTSLIAGILPF